MKSLPLVAFGLLLQSFSLPAHAVGCVTLKDTPHATLQGCDQLHLLRLRGNPVERAKAVGSMIGKELSSDVIDYFSEKVFEELHGKPGWLRAPVELVYDMWIRILHRSAPAALEEELDALALGAGKSPIAMKRGISLPDSAAFVNALGSHELFRPLPASGCTSVAVKRGKSFAYGRNLDFASAGIWDAHPLLTLILPEKGSGELKHIAFGADGAHLGGITGVNEAGISFAVHQNYSKDATIGGVPMFFVGELVLRSARSLDEAESLLRRYRPSPLWTFVITDLKTGEAMAVESSRKNFSARRMSAGENGQFVQTNHVMNTEVRPDEFISVGTKSNSQYRMETADAMLSAIGAKDKFPEKLARILSYADNRSGDLSAYHDIVKAHTIQTVILDKSEDGRVRLLISIDPAPTSGGRFLSFALEDFWKDAPLKPAVEDLAKTPAPVRRKQMNISKAFHAYFDQRDYRKASELLSDQDSLDARLFQAVLAYQDTSDANGYERALSISTKTLADPRFLGEPAYILQSMRWVRALSLLKLGRIPEAKDEAEKLSAQSPANLRIAEFSKTLAEKGALSSWKTALSFDFFSGDLSGRED